MQALPKNELDNACQKVTVLSSMKQNPIGAILVGLLFVCALVTTWLSVRYYFSVKDLSKLQAQYVFVNNTWSAVQSLATEAVQYSKHNPAIDPILQQFDLKPKSAAVPAANPPVSKSTK